MIKLLAAILIWSNIVLPTAGIPSHVKAVQLKERYMPARVKKRLEKKAYKKRQKKAHKHVFPTRNLI